ncbi:hypothetical protein CEXT_463201 [Caerostris extrusa]|uniref:Uncharacterized protein n=1 Tax=Caerostris extrusa TaxID=172846 RepID=A0AAV4SD25_CAEEX|nr:hypothetical protein CEXT_463201 [Caerostris extrusa]
MFPKRREENFRVKGITKGHICKPPKLEIKKEEGVGGRGARWAGEVVRMMIVAPETVIHRAAVGVEFRDDDVEARSWILMSQRCRACSCAVSRHLWSRVICR